MKKNTKISLAMITLTFIFAIIISGTVSAAPGDAIYVNGSSGNDSWDGLSAVYDSTSGSGPKLSIKSAIGTVNTNGTVNIADGIYTGVNNTLITINKNMNIVGQSQTSTIIDGSRTSQIFSISNGVNVTIQNLTFINGSNSFIINPIGGGAIYNGGILTITNIQFNNNTAQGRWGGAIANRGQLTIINTTFNNNAAMLSGAIYNSGQMTVIDSTFNNNRGDSGGAIANNNGQLNVTNTTFNNNTAPTGWGGAIYNDNLLKITGSTLENNTAPGRNGGAIWNDNGGTLTANFNRFFGNTAGSGSDIYNTGSGFNAEYNWWGSNNGPAAGSIYGMPSPTKWLVLTLTASPATINNGATSTITADLLHDNGILSDPTHPELYYHDPASEHVPDGIPVNFSFQGTPLGTLSTNPAYTNKGIATTTFTANAVGTSHVLAAVDSQTVGPANIQINPAADISVTKTVNNITPNVGDIIIYRITIRNNGPDSATNVVVTDVLPTGLTFHHLVSVGASGVIGSLNINEALTTNLNFNPNGYVTLDLYEIVGSTLAGQHVDNTASKTAEDQFDPDESNDMSTASIDVQKISTSLTVNSPSGYKGDTVDIVVTLVKQGTNTGIAGKTIYFTITGDPTTYTALTDPSGVATLHYTIGLNPGSYQITANNAEDDMYLSSIGYGTLTVLNRAPVATDTSITIPEDSAVGGPGRATDADGDPLAYSVDTAPQNGTVYVNPANGYFQYQPNTDFNGSDSFTVAVSDNNGGTTTYTIYITVTSVNDAPIAVDDSISTNEDTTVDIEVLTNDLDVDGDSLTVTGVSDPDHGTATINADGTVEYAPDANYYGTDSFTYTISDGNGGTATATVTVTINSVNDAPVATDDTATTKENNPVNIDVKTNDSDVEGDSLTVTGVSDPAHGTAVINVDGTVTYTPNTGYYGDDSFTYTVSDGNGGETTGTVSITVNQAVAGVYVLTTVSKNNPAVGETITLTFKLGNNGPDAADDVVFTYVIPEGMEFVGLDSESGYPKPVYDPATRTITWNLGTVPILDPWLKVNLKVLKSSNFNINPTVTTSTYDPTLGTSVQTTTVNAVNTVNAAGKTTKTKTIPLQHTGLPLAGLVLAVLAVLGGLAMPKRKN